MLDLTDVIRLSDEDLMKVCAANPDLRIEQNAAGQLEIIVPCRSFIECARRKTHYRSRALDRERDEGIVFDSSAGFRLPNGALRAPDAAWLGREKWERFTPEQREEFTRVVPHFLIEIRPRSDRLRYLHATLSSGYEPTY